MGLPAFAVSLFCRPHLSALFSSALGPWPSAFKTMTVMNVDITSIILGLFTGIRGTGTFIHKIFPHISSNKSHKWAA